MTVDLHRGAKNSNAKFRVAGVDLEHGYRALSDREEWGEFKGAISYKRKGDAQRNVTSVRIVPTFPIAMPTWPGCRNQPQECKEAWDTMWRALKKHETGHCEIFERGLSRIVGDLETLQDAKGSELDAFMREAMKAIQAEHNKFDRKTDHGSSRGVELLIPDKCRSKSKSSSSNWPTTSNGDTR